MNYNVDDLQPSNELNAIVAHRVMGFGIGSSQYNPSNGELWIRSLRPDGFGCSVPEGVQRFSYSSSCLASSAISSYSTDIVAAMEVADKFETIEIKRFITDKGLWFCEINKDGKWYRSYAKTVPLAICKAALLTVNETQTI